jgi:hypothetical protein
MSGFPRPAEVEGWEGGTRPPEPGNSGNTETPPEKPLTYAAEPVSSNGNSKETEETVFPSGSSNTPLSAYLEPGETATVEQLRRIERLIHEGMSERLTRAKRYSAKRPKSRPQMLSTRVKADQDTTSILYIGRKVTAGASAAPSMRNPSGTTRSWWARTGPPKR